MFRTLFALTVLLSLAACDSSGPEPAATTGTISGSISLPIGSGGDLGNTRVAIYTSIDDFGADRFVLQTPARADGTFAFGDVVPGTYYFDAWKDNNNNGFIDGGDYYGLLGSISASGPNLTPIQVAAGRETAVQFQISVLGGGALAEGAKTIR